MQSVSDIYQSEPRVTTCSVVNVAN